MTEAVVYTKEGVQKGTVMLDAALFEKKVNDNLIWEYVKHFQTNQRQGTAKAKGRGEVSGGGIKPWRQKGTGRARSGSNTSPIWVRGGKAFHPVPRDYYDALPRRKRRAAMLAALSLRAQENNVRVIEDLSVQSGKTRDFVSVLDALNLGDGRVLFITENNNKSLYLAARNVPNADVQSVATVNAYDVIKCANVVLSAKAIEGLKKKLSEEKDG
ncbi:MAG: 50S ribosomal protein L4 [Candidatus Raymondbacteria bacterium RifOxyA12_full_50_37]|uniref:Large ribosomal subunit protein uL4 n=1 Tax=Candidatus Raymondbacteria bacterium RIFOXYD12_FULL_49_13 TaxID=1817890 RepID=A0A1F7FDQ5_UNCRA|nr:ribosomal protein L4 [uncultured bacterium]OGJ88078.1 MAG: 50S ribosomal protein L4 [Candidatus Raymondbacteria bacterium RifOxyA12_full_50_37]OGJ94055.1 MAG: 50S ribosomal protein L4 [Candidatus Raymondbacteria bacterium RIFOXYA2_FULL_49_16]OGJ96880.1 MAG: 50S ribosomal protein L4 [Candidatus Raymondbacteria bacterium RIFOXYC2_FULL_50_21]OGJ97499.1 MAG: 50S ribosomal protein L4 [Candidatus Raymondbacteria bacterium RifOxyC12_full_50_8]OGK00949.1 MAG: 50S ribosomal protein L4 [Candidatus Ra